jgi:hypothetical protein
MHRYRNGLLKIKRMRGRVWAKDAKLCWGSPCGKLVDALHWIDVDFELEHMRQRSLKETLAQAIELEGRK